MSLSQPSALITSSDPGGANSNIGVGSSRAKPHPFDNPDVISNFPFPADGSWPSTQPRTPPAKPAGSSDPSVSKSTATSTSDQASLHRTLSIAPTVSTVKPDKKKKKSGKLKNFLTLKEPSQVAFEKYAEQQRKMAAQRGNRLSQIGVSAQKLPPTVPKVNSKWDGLPESAKDKGKGKDPERAASAGRQGSIYSTTLARMQSHSKRRAASSNSTEGSISNASSGGSRAPVPSLASFPPSPATTMLDLPLRNNVTTELTVPVSNLSPLTSKPLPERPTTAVTIRPSTEEPRLSMSDLPEITYFFPDHHGQLPPNAPPSILESEDGASDATPPDILRQRDSEYYVVSTSDGSGGASATSKQVKRPFSIAIPKVSLTTGLLGTSPRSPSFGFRRKSQAAEPPDIPSISKNNSGSNISSNKYDAIDDSFDEETDDDAAVPPIVPRGGPFRPDVRQMSQTSLPPLPPLPPAPPIPERRRPPIHGFMAGEAQEVTFSSDEDSDEHESVLDRGITDVELDSDDDANDEEENDDDDDDNNEKKNQNEYENENENGEGASTRRASVETFTLTVTPKRRRSTDTTDTAIRASVSGETDDGGEGAARPPSLSISEFERSWSRLSIDTTVTGISQVSRVSFDPDLVPQPLFRSNGVEDVGETGINGNGNGSGEGAVGGNGQGLQIIQTRNNGNNNVRNGQGHIRIESDSEDEDDQDDDDDDDEIHNASDNASSNNTTPRNKTMDPATTFTSPSRPSASNSDSPSATTSPVKAASPTSPGRNAHRFNHIYIRKNTKGGGLLSLDRDSDDGHSSSDDDDTASVLSSVAPSVLSERWFHTPQQRLGLGGTIRRTAPSPWETPAIPEEPSSTSSLALSAASKASRASQVSKAPSSKASSKEVGTSSSTSPSMTPSVSASASGAGSVAGSTGTAGSVTGRASATAGSDGKRIAGFGVGSGGAAAALAASAAATSAAQLAKKKNRFSLSGMGKGR